MCTTWHTLAARDTRLLRHQMDQICRLPVKCLFQNYIRCHDDIGWGLDYPWLKQFGMEEVAHKKYLNDWFTGKWAGSWSRGELYNDDPRLGDARLCGTTASLCGVEEALARKDSDLLELAVRCDLMLHAWVFTQSGVPVLYSGDEVAQLNDYGYHEDPKKRADSRNVHRGRFDWESAKLRHDGTAVQGMIFHGLMELEKARKALTVFRADAAVDTVDAGCEQVLGISRSYGGQRLLAYFNFSEDEREIRVDCARAHDVLKNRDLDGGAERMPGYGFLWLLEKE